jgi:hypothetical protein
VAKEILGKMSSAGDNTMPDVKLYYKAIVTNTAWYWQEQKTTKMNGIE